MTVRDLSMLLAYCQTAIRLGASRELAYRKWRDHHPATTRAEFRDGWAAALAAEHLFTEYGGVRRR